MAKKQESPQNVIAHYRKRQQSGPFWIGALAILLVGGGLIALLIWLFSGGGPALSLSMFATKTPTPTSSPTPTNTLAPSATPTITLTPTETPTGTPSAPFIYRVQENDSLSSISDQFNLGNDGISFLLLLNPILDQCNPVILVGQSLTIPNPDLPMPTATPISRSISPATETNYLVQPGDNLAKIAALFNSTVDDIMKKNKIVDQNQIFAGECIIVRINLVIPSATPLTSLTPAASVTATP